MSTGNEWLADLKVNDRVLMQRSGYGERGDDCTTVKVSRFTPTQICVTVSLCDGRTYEKKFRRNNGRELYAGGSWRPYYLHPMVQS